MARRKRVSKQDRPIESYDHRNEERVNNPPVGLVTPATDRDSGRKSYEFDPHLDPQLQWAGKAERTSFDIPTVSLHVHERIDPKTVIEATRRRHANGKDSHLQGSLFDLPEENPPIRNAIEFYRHRHNWTNRLVAGDSLLVMNSLLEKEGLAGKVQVFYFDPPYGIRYGSNFQPFVNRRGVRDGRDEDLTQEPEMIKAFRDTWELGVHSYLTYLRDRLLLARELLADSGSCFVQISDENVHRVRAILDEVFGEANFVRQIVFAKTGSMVSNQLGRTSDYILWYAREKSSVKYRQLYTRKEPDDFYNLVELEDGSLQKLTNAERANFNSRFPNSRVLRLVSLESAGASNQDTPFEFEGEIFRPSANRHWALSYPDGMNALKRSGRIVKAGKKLRWKYFIDDYPLKVISEVWGDTAGFSRDHRYVVQTRPKVIERCLLMASDPGDLVFDPTCGSGTTAYVAEQWGRRWITCDTSRVALTIAKQRLVTAHFDYYELAHAAEGVGSGFRYETVPHITLSAIANNPEISADMSRSEIESAISRHALRETLYDRPETDKSKSRVTGPFSVEAVPAPSVMPIDDASIQEPAIGDLTVARSGETHRQAEWREELLRTGIRGQSGQFIRFARLEPIPGCRNLHADGSLWLELESGASGLEGTTQSAERVVVSFGPEHAPLEQRQVSQAILEAQTLAPIPSTVIFAAFQFDPEAAKDIDETNWPGITILKSQMNADLLTEDLKRKRASNESYWLIGQPDVDVEEIQNERDPSTLQVSVQGFDYYNTRTGKVESGGKDKIAMWMLDPDYDGRSIYPRQIFFPMAGANDGWSRLAKSLKAQLAPERIEAYRGAVSLPFAPGQYGRIAVKIVDDRGIECLKVIDLEHPNHKKERDFLGMRSLHEILTENFKDVPQEEWDRLPDDLIDNLDHYVYGADRN